MNNSAPSDDEMAALLRALGHPARLSILRILASRGTGKCCCTDVTDCLTLAQSTVSQHIKVLLDARLIECHPQGTRNCYTVCADRISALESAFGGFAASLNIATPPHIPAAESI